MNVDDVTLSAGGFQLPNKRQVRYVDLLMDGESLLAPLPAIDTVKLLYLRPTSGLSVVGKQVEPVHVRRIVTGQETYSRDVHVKNMHYGVLARPPQLGVKHIGFDRHAAVAVPGVLAVVEDDGQLAVVAKTPMAATKGLDALAVEWVSLEGQSTLISIGIEENHWPLLVTDLEAQFESAIPDVAISVLAEPSNLLLQKLRVGLLDMAILYNTQLCTVATIEFLLIAVALEAVRDTID